VLRRKRIAGATALVATMLTIGTIPALAATLNPSDTAEPTSTITPCPTSTSTASTTTTEPTTSTATASTSPADPSSTTGPTSTSTSPITGTSASTSTSTAEAGQTNAPTSTTPTSAPTSTPTSAPISTTSTLPAAESTSPASSTSSATNSPQDTGRTTECTDIPNRSGVPWGASGVFMPGDDPAELEAFGAWRGAPVDVAVTWPTRQTWDDVINPTWVFERWKDQPYTMALGIAPVPEADDSATMAGCAAGQYNDKWVQFGSNFVANGMSDAIIRLGWEFNGNWYKWSASNPTEYAECFRQIVTSARTSAPDLRWDWTVNRGVSAGLADATLAYPGNEYVDFVGVDSYDMWPGANNDQTWEEHLNGDFGLKFWANFAREHGKKLTIPEWGVYPGTGSQGANGGDNALYVNNMFEFFASMGSDLAYEAYFNEDATYYAGAIFQPTQNPNAADTYQTMIAAAGSSEITGTITEPATPPTTSPGAEPDEAGSAGGSATGEASASSTTEAAESAELGGTSPQNP